MTEVFAGYENAIDPFGSTRSPVVGDVVAIDRITMTVPQGALPGLIGPSGSGKTTVIPWAPTDIIIG